MAFQEKIPLLYDKFLNIEKISSYNIMDDHPSDDMKSQLVEIAQRLIDVFQYLELSKSTQQLNNYYVLYFVYNISLCILMILKNISEFLGIQHQKFTAFWMDITNHMKLTTQDCDQSLLQPNDSIVLDIPYSSLYKKVDCEQAQRHNKTLRGWEGLSKQMLILIYNSFDFFLQIYRAHPFISAANILRWDNDMNDVSQSEKRHHPLLVIVALWIFTFNKYVPTKLISSSPNGIPSIISFLTTSIRYELAGVTISDQTMVDVLQTFLQHLEISKISFNEYETIIDQSLLYRQSSQSMNFLRPSF